MSYARCLGAATSVARETVAICLLCLFACLYVSGLPGKNSLLFDTQSRLSRTVAAELGPRHLSKLSSVCVDDRENQQPAASS